jgi:hypothetical protein
MMRKESKTVEEEVTIYVCDNCGSESLCFTTPCMICGKDVCKACRHGIDAYCCDLNNKYPSYSGDYPSDRICKQCWNDGVGYRSKIQAVRDQAEKMEEKLWEDWKNEKNCK